MTSHHYANDLVHMHYYKFGVGSKTMFCFHGYGMHGRQFRILEETLGDQYTFYGFDLFFHKKTILKDQSLEAVKRGITKAKLAAFFLEFCEENNVDRFSMIAYSMGSHFVTSLVEEVPERIEELYIAAPASLKPGRIVTFFSANPFGNKILERMVLSDRAMPGLLALLRKVGIIDQTGYEILFKEVGSPELRFSFYACSSYLRFLTLDAKRFVRNMNDHHIKSAFIFGKRDRNYPPSIGSTIIPKIKLAKQVVINENHDMINTNFAGVLSELINDH